MFDDTSSTNPFPGLRPFEAHENHLFFGRDGQSDDLLQRLSRQRFLAVVGTSGSGKSSLVRAGLLPALHGGFMLRAGSNWSVAIFRPGSNPIGRLAQALCRDAISSNNNVDEAIRLSITEASLRRSALGLIDVVRQARMNPQDNLLIVVDQFEELFRVKARAGAASSDDAAAFVKLLLEATRQSELPVYVLITMRSDFLGDCSQFRDLPEAINDGQYLIPRMTRDQRREAITGPAAVGGAQIAPRLVNRLLNDVGDNPDQLPLLQHALMRMWQQWEKDADESAPLDLSHYETIGGLNEAISQHADEAYEELKTDRSRRIAELLFKLLTERGSDNREIRRPTRMAEVCAVAEAEEREVLSVIEAFRREGRSFLMPPPNATLRPNTFIDISHESLIRGWRRLQRWVDDEALSARIYRRLAETAALHRAGEAGLWRDPDLAIALAWREKNHPNAAWGERYSPDFDDTMKFLDESRRARDAERLERERMRRRNLRLMQALAAVFLVGLCISLALGAFAYRQWNKAKEQTRQAIESEQRATAAEAVTRDARDEALREKDRAQVNERLAKDAKDEALKEKKEAEANAKRAQQAEASANASALLAKRKEQEARESLKAANAAREKEKLALDKAIQAQKAAEESEQRANNLSVRYRRNQLESEASRFSLAQRFAQISSTSSERAYWLTQQGSASASLGNHDRAIDLFTSALKEEPGNFSALSGRGNEYLINRQTQKALPDIEAAMTSSKNPSLFLNKTIGESYQGKYDDAIKTMQEAIKSFTHVGYTEYRETDVAGEIRTVTGQQAIYADSDAALKAFHYEMASLAASKGSKDFAPLLQRADALTQSSGQQEADARPRSLDSYLYALNLSLLSYQEGQRQHRDDYGALVAQGVLWRRAGYCQEAAQAFDAFKKKHRESHEPRYEDLSNWLASRPPEELQGTGDGCHIAPTRPNKKAREYLLEGYEYSWNGDFNKADDAFSEAVSAAVKEGGDDPDFLIERMKFRYFNKGDFAGAQEDAETLLSMNKGTALAYLIRAMSIAQLNAANKTFIDDVRKAKDLDPAAVPSISDNKLNSSINGKILVEKIAETNRDVAIDLLARSIKYDEPLSYPHYLLAKLLNDDGQFGEALKQIEIAIALDRARLDYFEEKRRAVVGSRGSRDGANGAKTNLAGGARDKFIFYSDAGDALSVSGQPTALSAYGESLKALNEIAEQTKNAEEVKCDVSVTVGKIFNLLSRSKDETVNYISTLSGLNNISPLIESELKKLSEAP